METACKISLTLVLSLYLLISNMLFVPKFYHIDEEIYIVYFMYTSCWIGFLFGLIIMMIISLCLAYNSYYHNETIIINNKLVVGIYLSYYIYTILVLIVGLCLLLKFDQNPTDLYNQTKIYVSVSPVPIPIIVLIYVTLQHIYINKN